MLKIVIKNLRLIRWLSKAHFLSKFITVDIRVLDKCSDGLSDFAYSSLVMGNKTSKQTNESRFTDLDVYLSSLNITGNVHDIGVSSGISSLKLLDNINIKLFISDKYMFAKCSEGFITRFYDVDNKFMFAYCCGIFISDLVSWSFFISKLLNKCIIKNSNKIRHSICLLHPKVLKQKINIIKDYDVFTSETNLQFQLVRCMNLLNLNYFDEQDIKTALNNIKTSLVEGGYLLVGRTENMQNNATLYQKKNNTFEVAKEFNEGYEGPRI
jgi:hypothetical protein